jgi:hypothetical protein
VDTPPRASVCHDGAIPFYISIFAFFVPMPFAARQGSHEGE